MCVLRAGVYYYNQRESMLGSIVYYSNTRENILESVMYPNLGGLLSWVLTFSSQFRWTVFPRPISLDRNVPTPPLEYGTLWFGSCNCVKDMKWWSGEEHTVGILEIGSSSHRCTMYTQDYVMGNLQDFPLLWVIYGKFSHKFYVTWTLITWDYFIW